MAETVKIKEVTYVVEVKVTRKMHAVINPNGRGYDADDISHIEDIVLLHSSVKAKTVESLQRKSAAILDTLDPDDKVTTANSTDRSGTLR